MAAFDAFQFKDPILRNLKRISEFLLDDREGWISRTLKYTDMTGSQRKNPGRSNNAYGVLDGG